MTRTPAGSQNRGVPRRLLLLALGLLLPLAVLAEEPYRFGPGDRLKVLVLGQPELGGELTVSVDGSVEMPFLGPVPASGRSAAELAAQLEALLADGYLKRPQVSVSLVESQRERVFVAGEVQRPGPYPLKPGRSLRGLLGELGGLTDNAGHEVLVVRAASGPGGAEPAADGLPPGTPPGSQVLHVSLRDLLSGLPESDLVLEPGDRVYFPRAAQVYVTGQAVRPGAYRYEEGLTVHRLLALAGGPNERGSSKVRLVRLVAGRREERRALPNDAVEPEDTLVVPERFF